MKRLMKKLIVFLTISGLSIPTNAAISVADGSAFVSKAEHSIDIDSLGNRLSNLENNIDSKIDSVIAEYLSKSTGVGGEVTWQGEKQEYKLSEDNPKLICWDMFQTDYTTKIGTLFYQTFSSFTQQTAYYVVHRDDEGGKFIFHKKSVNDFVKSFSKSGLCRVRVWNSGALNFKDLYINQSENVSPRSWCKDWYLNTSSNPRSQIDLSNTQCGFDRSLCSGNAITRLPNAFEDINFGAWGITSGYRFIRSPQNGADEVVVDRIMKRTDNNSISLPRAVDKDVIPAQTMQSSWDPVVNEEYFFVNKGDSLTLEVYDRFSGEGYSCFVSAATELSDTRENYGCRWFAIQIDEVEVY